LDSSDPQIFLKDAYAEGVTLKLGDFLGAVLRPVVMFESRGKLDSPRLHELLASNSSVALEAILTNRTDGAALLAIRVCMICCALLGEEVGVRRWATEGATRCQAGDGVWARSLPEWNWVLENPARYIRHAVAIKHSFNQL